MQDEIKIKNEFALNVNKFNSSITNPDNILWELYAETTDDAAEPVAS